MYGQQIAPDAGPGQATLQQRPTAVIHYTIYLPNGQSISSHETGSPYRFRVDSSSVIPGLEEAVASMEAGETRRIQLSPQQAFGEFRVDRVFEVEYDKVYSPVELKMGQPLRLSLDGDLHQAFVREERDHSMVFDTNHPLSGLELTMDVTLLGYE